MHSFFQFLIFACLHDCAIASVKGVAPTSPSRQFSPDVVDATTSLQDEVAKYDKCATWLPLALEQVESWKKSFNSMKDVSHRQRLKREIEGMQENINECQRYMSTQATLITNMKAVSVAATERAALGSWKVPNARQSVPALKTPGSPIVKKRNRDKSTQGINTPEDAKRTAQGINTPEDAKRTALEGVVDLSMLKDSPAGKQNQSISPPVDFNTVR